jgi:hypothetical protein
MFILFHSCIFYRWWIIFFLSLKRKNYPSSSTCRKIKFTFLYICPYAVYIPNVTGVPRGKWDNEVGSLNNAHKLTASTVMDPFPPVRLVYLPKMNACLNSDELDEVVVIIPLSNDPTVGTTVVKNSIHTNIPAILWFMVLFLSC